AFGSLVMIANVSSHVPAFGFCHGPHTPAMPRTGRLFTESRYFGRGSGAVFCHSKNEPAGIMQRCFSLSLQNGELIKVSERALNRSRSGSLNPHLISPT